MNPGKLLRRDGVCTELAPGQLANLVTFRPEASALQIESVMLHGEKVYASA